MLFSPLYKFCRLVYFSYYKYHQRELANIRYKRAHGRSVNWENPTEMNEKIIWMQFNTNTSMWSYLADKYQVRQYLEQKGYSDLLVPLLGIWYNAHDINFNALPKSFVLKTNHGSGDVIIVEDKSRVNIEAIRKQINKAFKETFGFKTAEPHYTKIKPCIIAESLLPKGNNFSSSLIDYKFYCVNGHPICCGVFYDRERINHRTNSTFYDMEWIRHDEWRSNAITKVPKDIPRPVNLNRMIEICVDLSRDFTFVRLDFYEVDGHLYFGEFTFTPAAYSGGSLSKGFCESLGQMMVIPTRK